ncbi:hypothetical protein B0H17DRAFT_128796 [Mycena rosella]|uniref:BTB domain-containing protein n=1 Tax=Mycena rosella TaxID=1033263 RepID=A0AAD7F862_MYCRO|nr:hypothetical protein B0H17DRAFT_128796 [Mycena rosella]
MKSVYLTRNGGIVRNGISQPVSSTQVSGTRWGFGVIFYRDSGVCLDARIVHCTDRRPYTRPLASQKQTKQFTAGPRRVRPVRPLLTPNQNGTNFELGKPPRPATVRGLLSARRRSLLPRREQALPRAPIFFERESKFFKTQLAVPATPGRTRIGTADDSAIMLDNVRSADFAKLLWVFYNPKYSLYESTIEDWSTILELAQRWEFAEVKTSRSASWRSSICRTSTGLCCTTNSPSTNRT